MRTSITLSILPVPSFSYILKAPNHRVKKNQTYYKLRCFADVYVFVAEYHNEKNADFFVMSYCRTTQTHLYTALERAIYAQYTNTYLV